LQGKADVKPKLGGDPTYSVWRGIRARCCGNSAKRYKHYGARGISLCARWNVYENFLADMGPRPSGMQIDRYPDNDGNYEPGNCRWATRIQNANNRSVSCFIDFRGERRTAAEWSRVLGIPTTTILYRLGVGKDIAQEIPRLSHPHRDAAVLEMRKTGSTFGEIAAAFGISRQYAHQIVKSAEGADRVTGRVPSAPRSVIFAGAI
jgi:hypothetical protein